VDPVAPMPSEDVSEDASEESMDAGVIGGEEEGTVAP
jgi:hypothetical protein